MQAPHPGILRSSYPMLLCKYGLRFLLTTTTVYTYGHTYSKSMDQQGKVANPARGQLNRESSYFLVRVCA